MASTELKVVTREGTGKGVARTLRRAGLAPAVVYGKGMESCPITVEPKALQQAIATEAGWNTLITLRGDGPFDGQAVILKDMQVDAIRRTLKHVDFQAIDLKKQVSVMVPVTPVGKSIGEREGGSLQVIRHEIEVICLPTAIPAAIEVDVTEMTIGDVLHIEELALPEGVEAPHDVNFTVLTCVGYKPEAVEEGEEGEEVEGAEEAEEAEEA